MSIGIYKITSPSGKVYIGQSWTIEERWYKYSGELIKKQTKIYNSIKKYGLDTHTFKIIHELPQDCTQEIMDNYEILYWQLYKDCGIEMLNIREPGRGGRNSAETRRKMSENNWHKKHKGKDSPYYGKKQTPEQIEKTHSKNRGKNHPMFGKFGENHQRWGKKQSEEWKELKRRKVINTETGEIYESVSKAEEVFGLKPATLRYHLSGKAAEKKFPLEYIQNIIETKQNLNL